MPTISSNILNTVFQLVPGFIVAWIVYGLTAYRKPSPFERVIQALIFTLFVKSIVFIFKTALEWIGAYWAIGAWNENVALGWSLCTSVVLGFGFVWCINNDFPFQYLRPQLNGDDKPGFLRRFLDKVRLTEKSIHPSEWFSALSEREMYVVLQLKDERRLFGWPEQYPDDPEEGHFVITEPEWLLDSGDRAPLYDVSSILIAASEVAWIELLASSSSTAIDQSEIDESRRILVESNKEAKQEK